jgi:hypothetical protein
VAIARQRFSKHVSAAPNQHATTGEYRMWCFYAVCGVAIQGEPKGQVSHRLELVGSSYS